MPGTALINLDGVGKLSRPATVLIEKISDAVGGVARPWQIKRVAEAEAEAQRTRAESEIEIADLQIRAGHRFIAEQTRIQSNIEDIARKSLTGLREDSAPEMLDDDWVVNFFDKCRNISNEDMQTLWSGILTGEANHPGSFSRKTVNLVADLEKSDAEQFTNLCNFSWSIGRNLQLLIFDYQDEMYLRHGAGLDCANHLQSLGLVTVSSIGFTLNRLPRRMTLGYCGRSVNLTFPKDANNSIGVGKVLLTQSGHELARICKITPVLKFFEYVNQKWSKEGLLSP